MANKNQPARGGSATRSQKQTRTNAGRDLRSENSGRTQESRGNNRSSEPTKSQMIRDLHSQGKTTGEIRVALMDAGFQHIHYSEIYGAIDRGDTDDRHDQKNPAGRQTRR